jgi:hypothetical protein
MAEQARPTSGAETAQPQPPTFATDPRTLQAVYSNFCRVSVMPEELVLDFGLNTQTGGAQEPVQLTQRLVINYYTAKRLMNALLNVVNQHESTFGVLEIDPQRRARTAPRIAARPPAGAPQ